MVLEGDRLKVTVITFGRKGDGIAYHNGLPIIILADCKIGERLNIRITKRLEKFAFAELDNYTDLREENKGYNEKVYRSKKWMRKKRKKDFLPE